MITIKQINVLDRFETLSAWWTGHGSLVVPAILFTGSRGFMAEVDGVEVAASFLYLMRDGPAALIEWTTTNPMMPPSKEILRAVKELYAHLEEVARNEGNTAAFSFVKPNSSEERILSKLGYINTPDDPGHRIYCKPLKEEAPCPL